MSNFSLEQNTQLFIIIIISLFRAFLLILNTHMQCSNWEKLSRGAQSNDLKTAFQVYNYLTQTRGGFAPTPPLKTLIIF